MLREDFVLTLDASVRGMATVLLPPVDLTLQQWQTLWANIQIGNPASINLAIASPIGSTTPSTGAFTTVSATSFTHNGSPYFRQQAQPISPAAGTRWDELTSGGLLVNQWEWDGTDWIEIVIRHHSCSERSPTSSTSFSEFFFPAGRVLIRRVAYGLGVNTTYNSTDYWQVNLRTRIPGDPTDYSSTLVTINTAVTSSSQFIVTPNQKTVAGDSQIHSLYTRFGSAVTLVIRASFQYSFIR